MYDTHCCYRSCYILFTHLELVVCINRYCIIYIYVYIYIYIYTCACILCVYGFSISYVIIIYISYWIDVPKCGYPQAIQYYWHPVLGLPEGIWCIIHVYRYQWLSHGGYPMFQLIYVYHGNSACLIYANHSKVVWRIRWIGMIMMIRIL